jgi:hypothetical protein
MSEVITKVVMLDIDGPMIPLKAYKLINQTKLVSVFDPCAAAMLRDLLKLSNARIVFSSTWRSHGLDDCLNLLEYNHIDSDLVHFDWCTTEPSTRTHEIRLWLDNHPEITHYVALDDEQLDSTILPGFVQCDMDEGMSYRNYLEAKVLLDIATAEDVNKIYWLKRKEIWRLERKGDEKAYQTYQVADEMYPVEPGLGIHWYRGV